MTPKQKLERLKDVLGHDDRTLLIDVLTSARHAAYDAGFKDGLEPFAYWKNGIELCGSSQTPLTEAKAMRFTMYNYKPELVDLLPDHMPAMAESKEGA